MLLKAILASPDEDTPRLMYADAIEESDPERAELIRVQIDFARLDEVDQRCPFVPEYTRPEPGPNPVPRWSIAGYCLCPGCEIVRREQPLLRELGPRVFEESVAPLFVSTGRASWSVEGPQPVGQMVLHGLGCVQWNPFRRGFIENWTFQGNYWVTHADKVTAAHPVKTVSLTTSPAVLTYDRGLRMFHFNGRPQQQFRELFEVPWSYRDVRDRLLKAYWPKIAFTLPAGA